MFCLPLNIKDIIHLLAVPQDALLVAKAIAHAISHYCCGEMNVLLLVLYDNVHKRFLIVQCSV